MRAVSCVAGCGRGAQPWAGGASSRADAAARSRDGCARPGAAVGPGVGGGGNECLHLCFLLPSRSKLDSIT